MTIDDIKKEAREKFVPNADRHFLHNTPHEWAVQGKWTDLDTLINTAYEAGREAERERVRPFVNEIGECLEYCAVQNGRPNCKNCGLTLEIYKALSNPTP